MNSGVLGEPQNEVGEGAVEGDAAGLVSSGDDLPLIRMRITGQKEMLVSALVATPVDEPPRSG
jgi:hypothetical protein